MSAVNAFVLLPIIGAFVTFMLVLGYVSIWSNLPDRR